MYGLLFGFLAILGVAIMPSAFAQDDGWYVAEENFTTTPQWGGVTQTTEVAIKGTEAGQWGGLITSAKTFINWVLGILGLIALALCLWAGFQMTTAGGDTKKFDDGKTILKNAAIGLAIIALSWLLVSLIFWIINNVSASGTSGTV